MNKSGLPDSSEDEYSVKICTTLFLENDSIHNDYVLAMKN